MNAYTKQHPYYFGIDLPAKSRYACNLDDKAKKVYHKNIPFHPDEAIAPFREALWSA